MSRTFKTADYDATLDVTVRLGDCLPPDHLARFVVDTIAQLDLSALYVVHRHFLWFKRKIAVLDSPLPH